MEDLTQQQMVLLSILVSFVTSIATSIMIVTMLTDSTPVITQTFNRIVEKTIETIVPSATSTPYTKPTPVPQNPPTEGEQVVSAVQKNNAAMVIISKTKTESVDEQPLGIGFSVGKGIIATDKNNLKETEGLQVTLTNGNSYAVKLLSVNEKTGIAFLVIADEKEKNIFSTRAVTLETKYPSLGQTILSLSGKGGTVLSKGIITEVKKTPKTETENESIEAIAVNFSLERADRGAPLFDLSGNVLGIYIGTTEGSQYFTPTSLLNESFLEATKPAETPKTAG